MSRVARVSPRGAGDLATLPDPALEREAEEAAQRAMAGGPVTINRMGAEVHVQRWAGSSASSQTAAERGETGYKSDPRATGAVASNHHYRHSADGSIDTEQLRRKLDGEQSIEEAIDQLLEEEGEELPPDVRERLKSLSNEAHDLSLEGLASSIGIGITTAVLGTLLSHWILLSVPFTTFVYLLKNTEGSLEQRLRQVQSFVQEETGFSKDPYDGGD